MTTLHLVDVDAANLILERVKGLLTLTEDHLYEVVDVALKHSIPMNAALWCLNNHVEQLDDLLNAGVEPEQEGVQR